jgi:glycosyltransferase involved in cell wall biosynthesis
LGFYYHVPATIHEGGILTAGVQGRFIDSLAPHFLQIVCLLHSPLANERQNMEYRIRASNVSLIDIGPHDSVPRRMLRARRVARIVRNTARELDLALLRGASPLLPDVAGALGALPIVLLLVSSYRYGVDTIPQPWWRRRLIKLWGRWNMWRQDRVARRALTLVNSRMLYRELVGRALCLHEVSTATLEEDEGYIREDTCSRRPVRLLYAGRMDSNKGLISIVEAVGILASAGEDIVLDLVGPRVQNDPVLDHISAMAVRLGIAQRVTYHGYKALGEDLFTFYRSADIFVLASVAEGFPRAMWEAMAHSLPVVATSVGSIPDYLRNRHEALLVAPRFPRKLAEAVREVIRDGSLRRQLIRNGHAKARGKTLQASTTAMVRLINDWYANRKGERPFQLYGS